MAKRKTAKGKFADLDSKRFGLAKGIIAGVVLFVFALWAPASESVAMIGNILPWYTIGFQGAIVGLIYGLILGTICGYIFAYLYNYLKGKV